MNKTIILIIGVFFTYMMIGNAFSEYTIPDEAIRIRIVPNSNEIVDQEMKEKVKIKVEKDIYELLKNSKSIEESRTLINEYIPYIKDSINTIFKDNNYNMSYNVNYGLNYFPEKEYKGVKYEAGMYESLYITIGEGCGDNWWCVLFPPICMLEAEESTDVEYRVFVKDIFNQYLSIN